MDEVIQLVAGRAPVEVSGDRDPHCHPREPPLTIVVNSCRAIRAPFVVLAESGGSARTTKSAGT